MLARGNARQRVFHDDRDRELFLGILARSAKRHALLVYAWCLMPNHYHLVVETPRGGLARAIHHLNGAYAQAFNRRHLRVGHLLQGRYKAILVQRESYLLELARYVVLNPVRAGICGRPEEFRWSSYRATAGLDPAPPFLWATVLLAQFGPEARTARARYRRFVAAGAGLPDPSIRRRGIALDDDEFVSRVMAETDATTEIPRAEREPIRPSLASLFEGHGERAIALAHREHAYTLAQIAEHLEDVPFAVELRDGGPRVALADETVAAPGWSRRFRPKRRVVSGGRRSRRRPAGSSPARSASA